ncbi:phytoene desaturase [Pseudenhygromyxa sp. WMMC2535]|uniref:1-hydroxycarotenoid 3,4-desaturase CrtD n=1 Tax=Pseudenhygromyxa sp. WMMC2535 TaxID=2712867 RepID=UPI0015532A72|nr:phytoene desaturase [Pseudenhygromyxa sp. WMMC2535]
MSAGGTVAENAPVVVVGGGVGGLSSAIRAAASGLRVILLERSTTVGGKMRRVGPYHIDAGPTVLTMRWAFDQLFASAGRRLDDYVSLEPLELLARHAWPDASMLDLFTDVERSSAAIEAFAGAEAAAGYRRFCAYSERIFTIVEAPFLRSKRPRLSTVVTEGGLRGLLKFSTIDWHRSMWKSLGRFFPDPRLRQLFARYATYYGSSPFRAPATLNLIAHVERAGTWRVAGGMYALAEGLIRLAEELGVEIRTNCEVERVELDRAEAAAGVRLRGEPGVVLPASAVIVNAAPEALDAGLLGEQLRGCLGLEASAPRSSSAVTWCLRAPARGFELAHHSVFFSPDYPAEFRALEAGELPEAPTVYICAQDRDESGTRAPEDIEGDAAPGERMLVLVNAPARGERGFSLATLDALTERTQSALARCGLELDLCGPQTLRSDPGEFERLFPGTGGALYGTATHAMMAPFRRPAARTRVPGLYLAGGGAHPGAGIPMVCLSGQLAGEAVGEDLGAEPP